MHDYRGLLGSWPGILQVHQGALGKRKECEKLETEGKVSRTELTEISNRTDVVSYAVLAEIGAFHQKRANDIKTAHQRFLREQIAYYQKVRISLSACLNITNLPCPCFFADHRKVARRSERIRFVLDCCSYSYATILLKVCLNSPRHTKDRT